MKMAQVMVTMEDTLLAFIVLPGMGDGSVLVQSNDAAMQVEGHAAHRCQDTVRCHIGFGQISRCGYTGICDAEGCDQGETQKVGYGQGGNEIVGWSVELPGKEDGGKHKGIGEDHGQCGYSKNPCKRDLEILYHKLLGF